MPTLRDGLLPVFNNVARKIPVDLGLRTNVVKLRTYTWTGSAEGAETDIGTGTPVDITITPAPKVTYNGDQSLSVVVTPQNSAGGYTMAQINPPTTPGQAFFWVVTGPDGVEREYKVRSVNQRKAFGYYVVLDPRDRTIAF